MFRALYSVLSVLNGLNAVLSGRGLRWLRNVTVFRSVGSTLRKR